MLDLDKAESKKTTVETEGLCPSLDLAKEVPIIETKSAALD